MEIIAGRIEDEGLLPSETAFSHITSRAVSDIAGFLGMIERFSRPGLKVICMKGPKWREELAAAAAVLEGLPFALAEVVERRLPGSGAVRALLVFRLFAPWRDASTGQTSCFLLKRSSLRFRW